MANDIGTNKFDYNGMAEGTLLTANDIGTNKFDNKGMAEGGLGTSSATVVPLRMLMGMGI